MKRLENFLRENPSYCKVSRAKLAARLNLSVKTVNRFWTTPEFMAIRNAYLNR